MGEFSKMLNVVENVDDKKAILAILKKAMDKGVVRNPKAYLAGIIKKYQNGEFTLVTNEEPKHTVVNVTSQ